MQYELIIETSNGASSDKDFITEVKKRLDFIESVLNIKIKHKNKNKP